MSPPDNITFPKSSVLSTPRAEHWTERFERQVLTSPDEIAVICGNRKFNYRELKCRAAGIAGLLRNEGIGPGDFVGVGLSRTLDLPAALLGVIESGAAYIPLDPSYPAARIEQMISSAKLSHVLTTPALADRFQGIGRLLLTETPKREGSVVPDLHSNSLIYAIFTSGSTGQPKAASVYHRGFANLLDWYVSELALGPTDSTLMISSPSFDLTQKNFFAPLISGGRLVLDEESTYDITRILTLIEDHGITLINCTPSAFYPLVDAAASNAFAALKSLRFAVLGGEPISIPRLRGWLRHPSCRAEVVNSYGPTECTDICAFHRLHRGNLDDFAFVPLGREVPNTIVSIRGEDFERLPDGDTGELCIGGAGVGGGYLNDPARTAERFIDSTYRTGDLAKRLPCGTLEFRGRVDHQVKVNGFRIELGEIELALSRHPDVREAVVLALEGRLVAWIQGTAVSLKDYLAERLPAYMIPGEFVVIESFPLTPNGKVDRKALSGENRSYGPFKTDGNSLESQILALWSEILERPVTDPVANFFDLGGNSIHVAIVHVRLMKMTGREFAITELFALPSARSIAAFLAPAAAPVSTPARDRARLAQAGFSNFRRPPTR